MRALAPIGVFVFIGALALGIAIRLDSLAAATLAGVLAGVMASVPASILVMLALRPSHSTKKETAREGKAQEPRIVYIVWNGHSEPPVWSETGPETVAFPAPEVILPEVQR